MKTSRLHIGLLLSMLLMPSYGCRHEPAAPVSAPTQLHGFPENIANIFINRCATAGCHNALSYTNAGNLLLNTWQHLFEPGNNGAVVVPYSPENSSLLYFINTDESLGPVAEPTMPLDNTPLSREEYLTIRNWIKAGAPDKDGNIPFAANAAGRQKIYLTQQGCDQIAVIDAASKVVMRYITVGKTYPVETPNDIVLSPNGQYAYVSFWNGQYIQKIDTRTDEVTGEVDMGNAYMKHMMISEDGGRLAVTNWYTNELRIVDVQRMQILYSIGSNLASPESIATNASFDTFYVTAQFGNMVYELSQGHQKTISIDDNPPSATSTGNSPNPYKILRSPEGDAFFISCQNTNEIRVLHAATETVSRVIPTGIKPQELVVCKNKPWLIVSCSGDTSNAAPVGSVEVINYKTGQVVKRITGRLFQPYGLAVDEQNGLLFVANRNQAKTGPRPHHSSPCNGRNGYYMVYDLNSLEPINNVRYEVTVDPYAMAVRFR